MICSLKAVDVQPPKGSKGRRPLERQIHLTVVTLDLLLLISNVFANQLLLTLHSVDIITSPPHTERLGGESPGETIAVLCNPDCALTFDEADARTHLVSGRNGYRRVDMVGHHMPLLEPDPLLSRWFMEHVADVLSKQSEQAPVSVFRYEYHMILALPFCMC